MFKKFDSSHDVSTSTPVKSSVQRAIKAQLLQQHPGLTEEMMDVLLPKKSSLIQYKVTSHLMLYCRRVEYPPEENRVPSDWPILFQHRDGPILPTLKWLLPYIASEENDNSSARPSCPWTYVTVDQGAIPFILGGAHIMCPGLTKQPGSYLPPEPDDDTPALDKGQGVVIFAEGKHYPIAVGVLTMSSREMYVIVIFALSFGQCIGI
jgi:malignant T-cell-amplified sequence